MPVETAQDPVRHEPGEMFGPYRLEETIGRGGMGEVSRAHDTGTYVARPFGFDVSVASVAERDAALRAATLRPASQVPTG